MGTWISSLVDWNMRVNFGHDPECLSMIQTRSENLKGLKVKRGVLIVNSWF